MGDLFKLLDLDGSDEIDAEEFVNGCMRLHGLAKSIDLATFMFDYKKWTDEWYTHADKVEAVLDTVLDRLTPRDTIPEGCESVSIPFVSTQLMGRYSHARTAV